MTNEPLFPVNLDDYRQQIDKDGAALRAARTRVTNTTEILRSRVVRAVEAGMSEKEASEIAGVTRDTVRRWLGK